MISKELELALKEIGIEVDKEGNPLNGKGILESIAEKWESLSDKNLEK